MKPSTDSCPEGANEFELARRHIESEIQKDPFCGRVCLWELRRICSGESPIIAETNIGRPFPHLTLADCHVLLAIFEPQSAEIERRCAGLDPNPTSPLSDAEDAILLEALHTALGEHGGSLLVEIGDEQFVPLDHTRDEDKS
jgi:hypothetical protein